MATETNTPTATTQKPEIKTVALKLNDQTFQLVVARKRTAGKEPFFVVQLNGSTDKNAAPPTFAQFTRFVTAAGVADAITPVVAREVLNDLTKAVSGIEGVFDADGNLNTALVPEKLKAVIATALAERSSTKETDELIRAKNDEAMALLNSVVEMMTTKGLPATHPDVAKAINRANAIRLEVAEINAKRVKNARAKAKAAAAPATAAA